MKKNYVAPTMEAFKMQTRSSLLDVSGGGLGYGGKDSDGSQNPAVMGHYDDDDWESNASSEQTITLRNIWED